MKCDQSLGCVHTKVESSPTPGRSSDKLAVTETHVNFHLTQGVCSQLQQLGSHVWCKSWHCAKNKVQKSKIQIVCITQQDWCQLQEKVFGAVVLGRCCVLHTIGVHLLHSLSQSVLVQHTQIHQVRSTMHVALDS